MRKTRLVLIPGVKSLDTIGCLLLFLACPTIAFKGQENREVDTICETRNLKEFWVDSPWPGDVDNIGWVRGYGGGTRPGSLQRLKTCNVPTTRSAVKSSRFDERRVEGRREGSRDNGIDMRKIRMENGLKRDVRIVNNRLVDSRDSRRMIDKIFSNEQRRIATRRESEDRRESVGTTSDREIRSERESSEFGARRNSVASRTRTVERRTITNREVIDGSRRETNKARTVANISAERQTIHNREVIDGRSFRLTDQVRDNRLEKQIRKIGSRQSGERAWDQRRNIESRRFDDRTNSRLATSSLERETRANRVTQQERVGRITEERVREAERRINNFRDATREWSDSARLLAREGRSYGDVKIPESIILGLERSVERRVADSRLARDRRDFRSQTRRQETRTERESQNEHLIRGRVTTERIINGEKQAIHNGEIIDGIRLPSQYHSGEMRYKREVQEHKARDAIRESSHAEGRRNLEMRRELRISYQSLDRQITARREDREIKRRQITSRLPRRTDFNSDDERRANFTRHSDVGNRHFARSVEQIVSLRSEQSPAGNHQNPLNRHELNAITRQSQPVATEEPKTDYQRERTAFYSRTTESSRSADERRVDERRHSVQMQEIRRSTQDRVLRADWRAADRRADGERGADTKGNSRITERSVGSQRFLTGHANINRENRMDLRRVERDTRNLERAKSVSGSRLYVDSRVSEDDSRRSTQSPENSQQQRYAHGQESIREERMNLERLSRGSELRAQNRRLSRSAEDSRRAERRHNLLLVAEIEERLARYSVNTKPDESSQRFRNREVEATRSQLRERRDVRFVGDVNGNRFVQRADVRQRSRRQESRREERLGLERSSFMAQNRRLSRSSDEIQQADMRHNLLQSAESADRLARYSVDAQPEESSRRIMNREIVDNRLALGNKRSQLRERRDVRSVGDVDRLTQCANVRRGNRIQESVLRSSRGSELVATNRRLFRSSEDVRRDDRRHSLPPVAEREERLARYSLNTQTEESSRRIMNRLALGNTRSELREKRDVRSIGDVNGNRLLQRADVRQGSRRQESRRKERMDHERSELMVQNRRLFRSSEDVRRDDRRHNLPSVAERQERLARYSVNSLTEESSRRFMNKEVVDNRLALGNTRSQLRERRDVRSVGDVDRLTQRANVRRGNRIQESVIRSSRGSELVVQNRRLFRSSEDVRRDDRRYNHPLVTEREERPARYSVNPLTEESSQRVVNREVVDNSRARRVARSELREKRDVRYVGDADRLTRRANVRQGSRTQESRRKERMDHETSSIVAQNKRLSRSSEDIRQADRHHNLLQLDGSDERLGRNSINIHSERSSRRVMNRDLEVNRLARSETRSHLLERREVRSVGDLSDSRPTRRADVRRGSNIVDARRYDSERESRNVSRKVRYSSTTQVQSFEKSRSDFAHETTRSVSRRRDIPILPSQTNSDRTIRLFAQKITNRQTEDESRSHHPDIRSVHERRVTGQELLRLDQREYHLASRQIQLRSADIKRIETQDTRDAKTRGIAYNVILKSDSIRTFPKDVRRSDRQRRVADVLTNESIRQQLEFTDLTEKPQRMDIERRYSGIRKSKEREDGNLANEANNFLEISKNAFSNWLTTDISRTDLNGIAETLIYGGIACFALFSNVNKKVIL